MPGSVQLTAHRGGVGGRAVAAGVADLAIAPDGEHIYAVDVGTSSGVSLPCLAEDASPPSTRRDARHRPDRQPRWWDPLCGRHIDHLTGVVAALTASNGCRRDPGEPPSSRSLARDATVSIALSPDRRTALATVGGSGLGSNAFLYPIALNGGTSMTGPSSPITLAGANPASDSGLGPDAGPSSSRRHARPGSGGADQCAVRRPGRSGHHLRRQFLYRGVRGRKHLRWDFGDGQAPGPGSQVVSHSYAAPGTYHVTLTETDSAGTSIPPAVRAPSFSRGWTRPDAVPASRSVCSQPPSRCR